MKGQMRNLRTAFDEGKSPEDLVNLPNVVVEKTRIFSKLATQFIEFIDKKNKEERKRKEREGSKRTPETKDATFKCKCGKPIKIVLKGVFDKYDLVNHFERDHSEFKQEMLRVISHYEGKRV